MTSNAMVMFIEVNKIVLLFMIKISTYSQAAFSK